MKIITLNGLLNKDTRYKGPCEVSELRIEQRVDMILLLIHADGEPSVIGMPGEIAQASQRDPITNGVSSKPSVVGMPGENPKTSQRESYNG